MELCHGIFFCLQFQSGKSKEWAYKNTRTISGIEINYFSHKQNIACSF